MKTYIVTHINKDFKAGYYSIHDKNIRRDLYIVDDDNKIVRVKDEQIGELYKEIKPDFT